MQPYYHLYFNLGLCLNAIFCWSLIYNPIELNIDETTELYKNEGPFILYHGNDMCAFLSIDGIIDIMFDRKDGSIGLTKIKFPHHGSVTGFCDSNFFAKYMTVSWSLFTMSFYFGADEVDEQWFLIAISMTFNVSDPVFKGKGIGGRVELDTPFNYQPLLKARMDRSFTCPHFGEIPLQNKYREKVVTLHIDNITVQPFGNLGTLAPGQICLRRRHLHDETIPLAIGISLAAFTVSIIAGYAVYRHIKLKKIQYGVME